MWERNLGGGGATSEQQGAEPGPLLPVDLRLELRGWTQGEHVRGVVPWESGNWLTAEEGRRLLAAFGASTPKERRNRAMIAVLIGCGLRRAEAAALKLEDVQLREGHWVIADLNGKGGHIRMVPMPDWVRRAIDEWAVPAGLTSRPPVPSHQKGGPVVGEWLYAEGDLVDR